MQSLGLPGLLGPAWRPGGTYNQEGFWVGIACIPVALIPKLRETPSSYLGHLKAGLLQCTCVGLSLKATQKLLQVQSKAMWEMMGKHCYAHITLILCELHWLPVGCCVQFKVPVSVFTSKALPGIGSRYIRICLSPVMSTQPVHSDKVGLLWVWSIKQCHLMGPQKWALSDPCIFPLE